MMFPRHLGALLMLGITVAACDDPMTPGQADAPLQPGFDQPVTAHEVSDGPRLIPNRVRYRDGGARPATGRAGSVELHARALLSSDGSAALDVATGDFSGWWSTGTLSNVLVKLLGEDGEAIWNRGWQSPGESMASYDLPGAGPGASVRVQATVKDSWSPRSGVVTLLETVRRRPDLAVTGLYLPPQPRLRTPALVEAVVEERNGEVGAQATCSLYVDDVLEDWMPWIWVDAGGAVTCAFAVSFRTSGSHTVRVVVRDVNPGDWDDANNAAEGVVEVSDQTGFEWWANADSDVEPFRSSWRSTYRATTLEGVLVEESESVDEHQGQLQNAAIGGWMPARVTFPLESIYLRQETAGRILHSQTLLERNPTWSWDDGDYGEACFSAWGRGPSVGYLYLLLCSGYARTWDGAMDEWTWVDYGRNAGEVTYHSHGYSRYFDEFTGDEYYYSWNYDDRWSEPGLVPYGDDYTLEVRVTDRGTEYPMLAVVPLESRIVQWDDPWTCDEWADEWAGLTVEYCWGGEEYRHSLQGWASGPLD